MTLSASSEGSNYANAYLIQSAAARLTHVTIVVSETGGGAGTGIEVWNGSNLAVDHVNVTATAPGGQSGALQCLGSSVSISNSILNAVGGGIQSNGILNDASSVNLQNSVVTIGSAQQRRNQQL